MFIAQLWGTIIGEPLRENFLTLRSLIPTRKAPLSTTVGYVSPYAPYARSAIGANEPRSVVVMISITAAQRDLLLNPTGNNIWSGQTVQSLNSDAVTWSLAKQLYGPSGPYFVIPMGIFIGFATTVVHWFVNKVS
jgi:hypothetical protein